MVRAQSGGVRVTTYTMYQPPKSAGYWRIGGNFLVSVEKRPHRLHRWFALALLGWQWVDHV